MLMPYNVNFYFHFVYLRCGLPIIDTSFRWEILMCMPEYAYMWMYVHICMWAHMCMYAQRSHMYPYVCAHVYVCIYRCVCACRLLRRCILTIETICSKFDEKTMCACVGVLCCMHVCVFVERYLHVASHIRMIIGTVM